MLSRFSIATTFAYQNTICFLRFQTVYYLFLILFYYFYIMFLCFFLSIYFFGYFYPVFHSQKIICIILHSKKGFLMPQFFIRICWWEVTMTVVIQIFCCRSFLPDEEFWFLYLRKPLGIMNSMIRSRLLCSVHTKILQRLICY